MVENGKNVEVDPSNLNLNPPDIQVETFIIIKIVPFFLSFRSTVLVFFLDRLTDKVSYNNIADAVTM